MVKMIKKDEWQSWISEGRKFKVVDVLDKEHYKKEHIKGAISLPVSEIEAKAKTVLKDRDETIVVYCASSECQASTIAAKKLMAMGYKKVYDYKGGIKDYKEAGLPLEGSMRESASACVSR